MTRYSQIQILMLYFMWGEFTLIAKENQVEFYALPVFKDHS